MAQGAMNAYGLTPKQEGFAQGVAKGETQSMAYRNNYDCSNMKPESVWTAAANLMNNEKVTARVAALMQAQEAAMLKDAVRLRRHVMQGLLRESEDFDKGSPMSRIRALELIGKTNVVGLFKDDREGGKERDPAEIEAELRDRLRSMFHPKDEGRVLSRGT